MVEMLPKWYRFEELVKLVRFIGVARPGAVYNKEELAAYVDFIEVPLWELSSTYIRGKRLAGKELRYLVPQAVESYIKEKRLYESLE